MSETLLCLKKIYEIGQKELNDTDRVEYSEGIKFLMNIISQEIEDVHAREFTAAYIYNSFLNYRYNPSANEAAKQLIKLLGNGKSLKEITFTDTLYGLHFKYDSSENCFIVHRPDSTNKIDYIKWTAFPGESFEVLKYPLDQIDSFLHIFQKLKVE